MALVITSKGKDFNTWMAARECALEWRQCMLEQTASLLTDQAEALFAQVERDLEERQKAHEDDLAHFRALTAEASTAEDPGCLRNLVDRFYVDCYDFFERNGSAPAFFSLSHHFLKECSASLIRYVRRQTGLKAAMALVCLAAGGRREYSPLRSVQLLLVHEQSSLPDQGALERFGQVLHESFQTAGLPLDNQITPKNPEWRGDLICWKERLPLMSESSLVKLADQALLFSERELGEEFRSDCMQQLENSRTAQTFLVSRTAAMSVGIGMMGGLKLEKRGAQRGLFGLQEHALEPISMAVGTLCLLKGVREAETTQRIRELLNRSVVDVEMAERLLQAWHLFSELRLQRERECLAGRPNEAAGFIDLLARPFEDQESLKEALETVASLQRHVGITFSSLRGF